MYVLNLSRQFELMRMKEDESIRVYAYKVMSLVNQLRVLGEEVSDKRVVNKMLVNLPKRFEAKISSLEDSKNLTKISLNELVSPLLAQEQKRALKCENTIENGLVAKTKCLSINGESTKKLGSKGSKPIGDGKQGKKQDKACNQLGHVEKVCKVKKTDVKNKKVVAEEIGESDEVLFMAKLEDQPIEKNTWLINNGYSNHLTDQNLLSVGQLNENHYALLFKNKQCIIFEPHGVELMTIKTRNKCYPLNLLKTEHRVFVSEVDTSETWHRRETLVKTSLVDDSKTINTEDESLVVRGTRSLQDIYGKCKLVMAEPTYYKYAHLDRNWQEAMDVEIKMIKKNGTWIITDRLENQKVIVTRHDIIRMLAALVAKEGRKIYHLDMNPAFLNGYLNKDIYIDQLERYKEPGFEGKVCKLIKAMYGLKQAPRAWYEWMDNHLKSQGFVKSITKSTLYVKKSNESVVLIVALYVDDLLVTRPENDCLEDFKSQMKTDFEMIDLGQMVYFLGMEFI
ncbi:Uncharacterized protein TCM_002671 [Theobroma cacao]|uniref:Reverse transcriptase Ty1/copia-type domain-containing protein n=1 Tax=Theobroma cacao TaxID=3641 RepID=A0A061DUU5_THECC|nr:Uncharacterized protein TCM_002671 [Theobroma cacao]